MEAVERVEAELKAAGIRVKVDDRDRGHARLQVQRLGDARRARCASRSAPRTWRRAPWPWPAATRPGKRASPSSRSRAWPPRWRKCSQRSRNRSTTGRWPSARPTPSTRRITPSCRKRSRTAGPVLVVRERACEAKVKEETKATTRCIPLEQPGGEGRCIVCGQPARRKVYFARAY